MLKPSVCRVGLLAVLAVAVVGCAGPGAGRSEARVDVAGGDVIVTTEADCAEEPTPDNLRRQVEAFDATVVSVDRGAYDADAAAAPLQVELAVNEWFAAATDDPPDTIVRDSWDFQPPADAVPESSVTNLGAGLEPGLRLLSAGSGEMIGGLQFEDDCGFTLRWSATARDTWRGSFGT